MEFGFKVLFVFGVVLLAVSSGKGDLSPRQICFIEYLKAKGKLDATFPAPESDPSICQRVVPNVKEAIISDIKVQIGSLITDDDELVDCVHKEFVNREAVDDSIKMTIVKLNKLLNETEKAMEVEAARNKLRSTLEDIAAICGIDENIRKQLAESV